MRPSWATTTQSRPVRAARSGFQVLPGAAQTGAPASCPLARYSQLLLLVTGPLGSGKTLLRQALVASTNKDAVLSGDLGAHCRLTRLRCCARVAQA